MHFTPKSFYLALPSVFFPVILLVLYAIWNISKKKISLETSRLLDWVIELL